MSLHKEVFLLTFVLLVALGQTTDNNHGCNAIRHQWRTSRIGHLITAETRNEKCFPRCGNITCFAASFHSSIEHSLASLLTSIKSVFSGFPFWNRRSCDLILFILASFKKHFRWKLTLQHRTVVYKGRYEWSTIYVHCYCLNCTEL